MTVNRTDAIKDLAHAILNAKKKKSAPRLGKM